MKDTGVLYIVSTPIGNLQDITLRAIETLKTCDQVICEDTRVTGQLLHHLNIKKPMKALNEFNEQNVIYEIIEDVKRGSNVCLVSDSGTPLISDPGYLLVKHARDADIQVVPIPGPTAVTAALSVSGLPTDSFCFLGFLSKNKSKKRKVLEHYYESLVNKNINPTLVFYESPHRIIETLRTVHEVFGDIEIVIARELTKVHEEVVKKPVSEFISYYSETKPKGEFVILINRKT